MKKIWILTGIFLVVALVTIIIIIQTRKEPQEIRIGAILPLTGESALMGQWGQKGIELAEEYINNKGGIKGIPLKVIIEDGQGDPKQSVSAYEKLVKVDRTKIITSIISAVDLALVPLANKDKIFFLSNATHPNLSNAGSLIFRHSNTVQQEVDLILENISDDTKTMTLAYMNDEYSLAFKEIINKKAVDRGLKMVSVPFEKGETDFNLIAIKIMEYRPTDCLVVSGLGRNLGLLIAKLKEKGFDKRIIVTLGFVVTGADRSAGNAIKGVNGVYFDINSNSPDFKKINELYKNKFNEDMPIGSLLFFNSLSLMQYAIENTGPLPEKMAIFLKKITRFEALGEKMTITESNDINPSLKIITF
jgi:branched-chain amino acid transport system substrate-binding protein